MSTDFGPARLRPSRRQRSSSYDRTGGNCDHWRLHPREQRTLLDVSAAGCVRHIWFTIGSSDPLHLRNIVLRAFWDGEPTPSVLCPIGDFFGQGHGVYSPFDTPLLAASPRGGRAMNCFFPMPFARGARITVENQSDCPTPAYLYFYIDYETLEQPPADVGRFHAHWRRECLTHPDADLANLTGNGNFLVAEIAGQGQYVGTILFMDSPSLVWNGEGDDMFFVDDEPWPPRLHGTGTEDYVNTAWCPREKSDGTHQGVILAGHPHGVPFLGKSTYYRFHTADPIGFEKSLRFSIEHGTGNEFVGDWAATSFWYALGRTAPLPDLPAAEARAPLPALPVEAGKIIEQPHKCLSYFFQTDAAAAGDRLIQSLEGPWRAGQMDEAMARAWAQDAGKEIAVARSAYLQRAGKIVRVPEISRKAEAAQLVIDRIHGSQVAAPRAGKIWLAYDRQCLHVTGRFDIARRQQPGYCYDRVDLMLAPEDWPDAFAMLSISPDRTRAEIGMHRAHNPSAWLELFPLAGEVAVEIEVTDTDWGFACRAPWSMLELPAPRGGTRLNMNVDRWNFADSAWWASWALTPHHFYPPQMGGLAILED